MSTKTSNPAGSPKITDTTPPAANAQEQSEFENFEDLARKVVAVPKREVDKKRGKKT